MSTEIIVVAMQHQPPAGAIGPDLVTLDRPGHLVPYVTGLVLVDTAMAPPAKRSTAL